MLGDPAVRGSAASRDEYISYLSSQSRVRQWRIRSRTCAAVDMAVLAAGAAACTLTAADVLSTWHTSHALIDHQHLTLIMGVILAPCWIWLLGSIFLMGPSKRLNSGRSRKLDLWRSTADALYRTQVKVVRRNMYPGRRSVLVLLAVGVLCISIIVIGFALGAAKGSGYVILPGPRYEISTMRLNSGTLTTVSASQYAYWEARFVRLDALFSLFGLFMIGYSLALHQLHRTATAWTPAFHPGSSCP